MYIAPFFIGYFLFSLYPTLYALILSFFEWSGFGTKKFIGLENYVDAFRNRFFLRSLRVSGMYILTGPVTTFIALVIAFLLNGKMVFRPGIYKIAYLIPNFTMPVAVGIMFKMIFGWEYGILNRVLLAVGVIGENINWLGKSQYVFFVVCVVVVWKYFGYHVIIYLGGLLSVDTNLYEAARIDGANSVQIFYRVTIPLLKPFIVMLLIQSINGGINLFDEPMMLYSASGGSNGAAQNAGLFLYFTTFVANRWGFGSALSFIVFCIVCALSIFFYKINYRMGMER
jgi:ABC-type sugar transport system permease subunit